MSTDRLIGGTHAQDGRRSYDSAVASYGEGQRAHRTALAALKHSFETVGDHWEPKDQPGSFDAQAAQHGRVTGRSRMTKAELVEGIDRANRRETAAARDPD